MRTQYYISGISDENSSRQRQKTQVGKREKGSRSWRGGKNQNWDYLLNLKKPQFLEVHEHKDTTIGNKMRISLDIGKDKDNEDDNEMQYTDSTIKFKKKKLF